MCGRCRKKLQPGDRVTYCMIVGFVGSDPLNLAVVGANMMRDEYEVAHLDCHDPNLSKGVITP